MNGLSLLALVVFAVVVVVAYRLGRAHARRAEPARSVETTAASRVAVPAASVVNAPAGTVSSDPAASRAAPVESVASVPAPVERSPATPSPTPATPTDAAATQAAPGDPPHIAAEKARLIIAYEAEATRLRRALDTCAARAQQLEAFAEDRRALYRELAQARSETARYRQIIVDLENDAPPPILGERGAPDDLKLIVGVGPVLERMLQQLGVATYRQIARWTEHDIDAMDARLPEFHGRIRRDEWVTQARALHQSKYGERP